MEKLSDDILMSSNEFLYLGPDPGANHLCEWMGGTKCNFGWVFPIKTHYRKILVIEKELNIDYLCRINFDAYR